MSNLKKKPNVSTKVFYLGSNIPVKQILGLGLSLIFMNECCDVGTCCGVDQVQVGGGHATAHHL